MSGRTARRRVTRLTVPANSPAVVSARADLLAAEEPLGIRVGGTALSMTMRTPGDDVELAAGFLVGEAIARGRDDITAMKVCDGTTCGHLDHTDDEIGNIVDITLAPGVEVRAGARRNFMTTSACGVCGKTSVADLCVTTGRPLADGPFAEFDPQHRLPMGPKPHPGCLQPRRRRLHIDHRQLHASRRSASQHLRLVRNPAFGLRSTTIKSHKIRREARIVRARLQPCHKPPLRKWALAPEVSLRSDQTYLSG